MKKYLKSLALATVIAGLITSCSDSTPTPTPKDTLIGSWKESNRVITECTNETSNKPSAPCGSDCRTIVINENSISLTLANGSSFSWSYTKSADTFVLTPAVGATVTYSLPDSKTLILSWKYNSSSDEFCKDTGTYIKQ